MNNTRSQVANVVKVKNDIFLYPKTSRGFTDLTTVIKTNDKGALVQLEISLLLAMQRNSK